MSEKPKFYENAYGDPYECGCCGYHAPLFECRFSFGNRPADHVCEVCYSTFLLKCVEYPAHCNDEKLHRSVGWIANRILAEINPKLYDRDQFETVVIEETNHAD
jgi:hypothetical protein